MLTPDYTFRLRAGRWAIALLVGILGLGLLGCEPQTTSKVASAKRPFVTCTEDMGCWDCTSMGNSRCFRHDGGEGVR